MVESVADEVFSRVEALTAAGGAATRAEAIRQVAAEMERSVSATSSAFYAGARRAREQEPPATRRTRAQAPAAVRGREAAPSRRARGTGRHSDAPKLYAEMLPLVEAGATIEQAARRFGDEEGVPEIAAGFARWLEREGRTAAPDLASAPEPWVAELERGARDAQARITALEAENRELRRELTRARQAITRVRAILDSAS
jgi:hypothetical protein